MIKDTYLRTSGDGLYEYGADLSHLAGRQVRNIIKLRLMKRERLWKWSDQKDIFTSIFS